MRYSTVDKRELISENSCYKDNIAYIDDLIGSHSVENPNDSTAITLHLYTLENYKMKKQLFINLSQMELKISNKKN